MLITLGKSTDLPRDPFMDKPFNFYSHYVQLAKNDKEDLMEKDLVKYYKAMAMSFTEQLELKDNEKKAQKYMMDQLIVGETDLNKRIDRLNNQIERMTDLHAKEVQRTNTSY